MDLIPSRIVTIVSDALDGVATPAVDCSISESHTQHVFDLLEVLLIARQGGVGPRWTRAHVMTVTGLTVFALRTALDSSEADHAVGSASSSALVTVRLGSFLTVLGLMAHQFLAEENAVLYCAIVSEDVVTKCWEVYQRQELHTKVSLVPVLQFLHVCLVTSQHAVAWHGTLPTRVVEASRKHLSASGFDVRHILEAIMKSDGLSDSLQLSLFRLLSSCLRLVRQFSLPCRLLVGADSSFHGFNHSLVVNFPRKYWPLTQRCCLALL